MIGGTLDGDLSTLGDAQRLVWMPAHQSLGAIWSSRTLSNGRLYSVVDWRANRLVDAIAKAFANENAVPNTLILFTLSARAACRHSTAVLGYVTHEANNHVVQVVRDDGSTVNVVKRDVMEPAHKRLRKVKEPLKPPVATVTKQASSEPLHPVTPETMPFSNRVAKRPHSHCVALRQHNKRARLLNEQLLLERVKAMGAACTANPENRDSATGRMRALAERVRARAIQ